MSVVVHQPQAEPRSQLGTPTWELATVFPYQGEWTEAEYLALDTNRLIEFTNGVLEFLSMPSWTHQWIVDFLHTALKRFVEARQLGRTAFAPLRVRLPDGKFREPDVIFSTTARLRDPQQPSEGADLIMEVVSEHDSDRQRDYIDKRRDYSAAGVPEYWIVDPELQTITVLTIAGDKYNVHGEFKSGENATSKLLSGFEVNVAETFASAAFDQ